MTRKRIRYTRNVQRASRLSSDGLMDNLFYSSKKDKVTGKIFDDLVAGGSSGYGYTKSCGINLAILATALAGIGAMAYVLYSKITMNGGRRKKRSDLFNELLIEKWDGSTLHNIEVTIISGMPKFINLKACAA